MNPHRPLIGISVGDPAGIGPEITVKALNNPEIYSMCRPIAVADASIIQKAIQLLRTQQNIHTITSPDQGIYMTGTLDVLDLHNIDAETITQRQVSAECGRAAYQYVEKAIELALAGDLDATVTGPINKEAIHAAGVPYAGHTEIYAALTRTKNYAMMLMHEQFRVIHVSTHVALREACERVKYQRVLRVIHLAHETLRRLGISQPRIAVAGLNPHAGEHGLFGREEIDEIIPAIHHAQQEGLGVEGPFPPDTIFSKLHGGHYDIVVAMYHDQGHIPTKLLGFQLDEQTGEWKDVSGVNITCGLPIVRVSVDHGTAFDIAWKGRANPNSMLQAIQVAAQLSWSNGVLG